MATGFILIPTGKSSEAINVARAGVGDFKVRGFESGLRSFDARARGFWDRVRDFQVQCWEQSAPRPALDNTETSLKGVRAFHTCSETS